MSTGHQSLSVSSCLMKNANRSPLGGRKDSTVEPTIEGSQREAASLQRTGRGNEKYRLGDAEADAQEQTTAPGPAKPVLSAVVFAYRNEETVLPAVSSLVQQDFEEPFEVIVATSGEDKTAELVRKNYPGVRVVESPVRLLPGAARNLGMDLARGEIIAFLEAKLHCTPGLGQEQGRGASKWPSSGGGRCCGRESQEGGGPGDGCPLLRRPAGRVARGPRGTVAFAWSLVHAGPLEQGRPFRRGPTDARGRPDGEAPPVFGRQHVVRAVGVHRAGESEGSPRPRQGAGFPRAPASPR